MQVVLVYFQPFRCNLLLNCVSQRKIVQNSLKPFRGLRSFKVIDVNRFKTLVTSACYNKQHVCTYL